MKMTNRPVLHMLRLAALIVIIFLLMQPAIILHFGENIALLFPDGKIAREERDLLFILQAIMLFVVFPVYILTFIFSWKYRWGNRKAQYDPDLVDNKIAEVIWWGLPCLFTLIIIILTWVKTYELDPYKSLESKKPLKIQVVALQWKWLFIYPEEQIASVNFLQIPEKTPIHFQITADAPMNSFWIPDLGGQIYAMPKMQTELHLIADNVGDFRGCSANISGEGFSGMHFITRASSEKDYHEWVESVKKSTNVLNLDRYEQLAAPSKNHPVESYLLQEDNLFNHIISKFMHPKKNE